VGIYGKIHVNALHSSRSWATAPSALAEIKFRPYKDALKAASTKKPKRDPFVARFFLGEIDRDLFEFPEMTSEHMKRVNDMVSIVQGFYDSNVDKWSEGGKSGLSEPVLNGLRSMGLFGLQVPKLYSGLQLGALEMNRFTEVLCQSPAIFHMLNSHNMYGVNLILSAGTEAQKQAYLPKLASGEKTLGVCIWEKNCGSDVSSVETKAAMAGADSFTLTGTKVWVMNADLADEFLVLANVASGETAQGEKDLCLFLVDKNSPGVTVKKVEVNTLEQLGTFEVAFDNVIVERNQTLGKQGAGFELANSAIFPRTSVLPCAVSQTLRSLFGEVVNHVITREQFGRPLYEFDSIKWKLTEASVQLYVLESLSYLTAGLHDEYDDQDTIVECAISKVYALDTLHFCLRTFADIFSSHSLLKEFAPMKYFKDTSFFHVCEGTRDLLRLHIALHCLRYLGNRTFEHVVKVRNPLYFPWVKWRDHKLAVENSYDRPTLTKVISDNVHPSLSKAADTLEYCILRLKWVADLNIIHYGAEITDHQNAMLGLADIAIECYAMSAAIARASRSYCIGLKNADYEIMAAHTYVTERLASVRKKIELMDPHNPPIYFETVTSIAEAVGVKKGFFAEHPIERTYH